MAKQLVIVGVGDMTLSLIELLTEEWVLTVIDLDEAALARVGDEHGGEPVKKIQGDATSRLVLEKIGLTTRSRVAIATDSDEANLEIARLIRRICSVAHLVCVLDERERCEAEADLVEVEAIDRHEALASIIFNRLCWTESRGVGLGLGQGELLETRVLDGSPAAGRPLRHLHPQQWLVAAVFRKGQLIVPHGDTVLEVDDRVLLVGEPDVLQNVGAFIRGGEPVFPQQFGAHIGRGPGDQAEEEAQWLKEITRADSVVEVDEDALSVRDERDDRLAVTLHELDIGCLVIESEGIPWPARVGITRSRRKRLIGAADVPVLVARGKTPPVRKILLAVSADEQVRTMAHVAIDLARLCDAELTVLTVLPPSLAQGEEQLAPLREVPEKVAHIAKLYDLHVGVCRGEGNPISAIRQQAESYDLLVLGNGRGQRNTLLTPDVALFLLHEAPCSTLFVPWDATYR
jgi:Trk K+ transport system NAD-binding subunit/nucleotide-binding universal stress UspA family protein